MDSSPWSVHSLWGPFTSHSTVQTGIGRIFTLHIGVHGRQDEPYNISAKSLSRLKGREFSVWGGIGTWSDQGQLNHYGEGRQMQVVWEIWKMRYFWFDFFSFFFFFKWNKKTHYQLEARNGRRCWWSEGSYDVLSLRWGWRVTWIGDM